MVGREVRTGLTKYLGGVMEAVEELVVDTRECVEGLLEHSGSVQHSAVKAVRSVLRPGSGCNAADAGSGPTAGSDAGPSTEDLVTALRAENARLTVRLNRYESASAADPA